MEAWLRTRRHSVRGVPIDLEWSWKWAVNSLQTNPLRSSPSSVPSEHARKAPCPQSPLRPLSANRKLLVSSFGKFNAAIAEHVSEKPFTSSADNLDSQHRMNFPVVRCRAVIRGIMRLIEEANAGHADERLWIESYIGIPRHFASDAIEGVPCRPKCRAIFCCAKCIGIGNFGDHFSPSLW